MKKILFSVGLLIMIAAFLLGSFVVVSGRQVELLTSADKSGLDGEPTAAPIVHLDSVSELDSFAALLDHYNIELNNPTSLQEFEEELSNIGSLEQAENEYEELWKDFVDSLELSSFKKGQVGDVLVRSSAHNDELMQLFSAGEISQDQVQKAWVTETEVADALSNFLAPTKCRTI